MDELKTTPNEPTESAPVMAAKALDAELGTRPAPAPVVPPPVNDLTSIVKKKKKPVPEVNGVSAPADASGSTKRKAESDAPESPSEKKAKVEVAEQ